MFGLVQKVKNQIRKAEAAAALENLLKIQAELGNLQGSPHMIANNLISETWETLKKHSNWKNSTPPHKVSIVAISLAGQLEKVKYGDSSFFAFGLSLGTVLSTAARNYSSLGFTAFDEMLLNAAAEVQKNSSDELEKHPIVMEIDSLLNSRGK